MSESCISAFCSSLRTRFIPFSPSLACRGFPRYSELHVLSGVETFRGRKLLISFRRASFSCFRLVQEIINVCDYVRDPLEQNNYLAKATHLLTESASLLDRPGVSELRALTGTRMAVPQPEMLFRDEQIRLLTNLLGPPPSVDFGLPAPVFISGSRGCGKTSLLKSVLNHQDVPPLYIDCMLWNSVQLISRRIFGFARSLPGSQPVPEGVEFSNLTDGPRLFRMLYPVEADRMKVRLVIALDGVEHVKKLTSCAAQFFHFQKSCGARISLVFASRSRCQTLFGFQCQVGEVMEISLPNHSKKQLVQLVVQNFASSKGAELNFVQSYASLIVDNFYPVTRDVRELSAYAERYYEKYTECIRDGQCGLDDTRDLWRSVLPVLGQELRGEGPKAQAKATNPFLAVPQFMRYLLVAGFLCSYNASKFDARMTAKRHDTVRKTKQSGVKKKVQDKRLTILGPQSFSFRRIFGCLSSLTADENIAVSALQVQTTLKSLCDRHLFVRVGPEENLDSPRYRCVCEKNFVQNVASSLGLDLHRYIVDFV